MESPTEEIHHVLSFIGFTQSPELQRAAIEKYFLDDVAFESPLCVIECRPDSRQRLIGLYRFLHAVSPRTKLVVHHVTYERGKYILFLDATRHLRIFSAPFLSSRSRLLMRLSLKKHGGLYYIFKVEEFLQPDAVMGMLFPPLGKRVTHFALFVLGYIFCWFLAALNYVGIHRVNPRVEQAMLKSLRREGPSQRRNTWAGISKAISQAQPINSTDAGEGGDGADSPVQIRRRATNSGPATPAIN